MLGAAVQCWSLLRSVPKLIKFQARFPFLVRPGFYYILLYVEQDHLQKGSIAACAITVRWCHEALLTSAEKS